MGLLLSPLDLYSADVDSSKPDTSAARLITGLEIVDPAAALRHRMMLGARPPLGGRVSSSIHMSPAPSPTSEEALSPASPGACSLPGTPVDDASILVSIPSYSSGGPKLRCMYPGGVAKPSLMPSPFSTSSTVTSAKYSTVITSPSACDVIVAVATGDDALVVVEADDDAVTFLDQAKIDARLAQGRRKGITPLEFIENLANKTLPQMTAGTYLLEDGILAVHLMRRALHTGPRSCDPETPAYARMAALANSEHVTRVFKGSVIPQISAFHAKMADWTERDEEMAPVVALLEQNFEEPRQSMPHFRWDPETIVHVAQQYKAAGQPWLEDSLKEMGGGSADGVARLATAAISGVHAAGGAGASARSAPLR